MYSTVNHTELFKRFTNLSLHKFTTLHNTSCCKQNSTPQNNSAGLDLDYQYFNIASHVDEYTSVSAMLQVQITTNTFSFSLTNLHFHSYCIPDLATSSRTLPKKQDCWNRILQNFYTLYATFGNKATLSISEQCRAADTNKFERILLLTYKCSKNFSVFI